MCVYVFMYVSDVMADLRKTYTAGGTDDEWNVQEDSITMSTRTSGYQNFPTLLRWEYPKG